MIALLVVTLVAGLIIGNARRGGPVRVTELPSPSAADAAACKKLSDALPATIGDGLKSRKVTPASSLVHAWGTPGVVMRCGVGYPPNFATSSQATQVGGVVWIPTQISDAVVYTAAYQSPRVSVAVPSHYSQSFDILTSVSGAVRKTTQGR
jgi:Protein of unknown function (DUF3515)